MKTIALSLAMLAATNSFAQFNVKPSDLRVNRPIRIGRDIRLPKTQTFSVEQKVLEQGEKEYQADLKAAINYLDKKPDMRKALFKEKSYLKMKTLVKKGEFRELRAFKKPIFRTLPNSDHQIRFNDEVSSLAEIGSNLRKSKNIKNLQSVYQRSYKILSKSLQAKFLSPGSFKKLKQDEAEGQLYQLLLVIKDLKIFPIQPLPGGFTYDCEDEIGYQKLGTGDSSNRCKPADFHAESLYNKKSFPLKYYNTCIKSQGSRGTCVGFAINAAVESMLMVKDAKSYNLSEQFTYFYGEIYSNHSGRYNYGLNTGNAIKKMDSKNIRFQYEKYWEYNPSNSMDDKSGDIYPDSCVGYPGEMCTNYAFQAQENVTGFWPFKNYSYTVPYRGTGKRIEVIDYSSIMFWWSKELSLDTAIAYTNAKVPVVVSFDVKQNFMDTDDSGIVKYKSGEDQIGGHASVILGFVNNSELPAGTPNATEKGYFIVKNSWGTWNGDCGYYYVDYKYFKKYAKGLYIIELNS